MIIVSVRTSSPQPTRWPRLSGLQELHKCGEEHDVDSGLPPAHVCPRVWGGAQQGARLSAARAGDRPGGHLLRPEVRGAQDRQQQGLCQQGESHTAQWETYGGHVVILTTWLTTVPDKGKYTSHVCSRVSSWCPSLLRTWPLLSISPRGTGYRSAWGAAATATPAPTSGTGGSTWTSGGDDIFISIVI